MALFWLIWLTAGANDFVLVAVVWFSILILLLFL